MLQDATKTDLVDLARLLGHPVTPRLIDDWVSLGLLDQPHRQGLGRGMGSRATWPPNQVRLFEWLLAARLTATRVKTLCNLPVWLWLTQGDDYVPLRQARRALATWVHGSRTTSWGRAREAAASAAASLPASVTPRQRRVVAQLLTDALERGVLDEARLTLTLAKTPDVEDHVRTLRARFAVMRDLALISDDVYLEARAYYRWLDPPMRRGDLDFQEHGTRACLYLVTILGIVLHRPEAPVK